MDAEEKVRSFYDGEGWKVNKQGHTADAELFEDLRPCSAKYVSACREKILKFLPKSGERILDAASGPIQYPEYLNYSTGFKTRVCVDISVSALTEAKKKLGSHGEIVHSSILDLPFPENHFDATISLHTIYHIDSKDQEAAVKQLIRVTKPEAPIVIVYSNPDRLVARLKRVISGRPTNNEESKLYFFCHPLGWWKRFQDEAEIEIHCWRSLTAKDSQRFIPNNQLGQKMLSGLLKCESLFSRPAAYFGAYPIILLKKRLRAKI